MALVLAAEGLDQIYKVELLPNVGLVRPLTHLEASMGRPRKPPSELTTEQAVRKLFPAPVVKEAKKTAREAEKRATREDSKG